MAGSSATSQPVAMVEKSLYLAWILKWILIKNPGSCCLTVWRVKWIRPRGLWWRAT